MAGKAQLHMTLRPAVLQVVHGRDIPAARLVDDGVMRAIQDAAPLAPLHNPANLEGIRAASAVFSCPQVSCAGCVDMTDAISLDLDPKCTAGISGSIYTVGV